MLELCSAEAPTGRAAPARVGFGAHYVCRHLRRQVHAHDRLVHRQSPIVAKRVPVELVVIGQELGHAIRFVAHYKAMIAGREWRPRHDAQLLVARIAALLVGDGSAILADFQYFYANAGVFGPFADEAPVPTRLGVDGKVADHSVAEVVAFAVHCELLPHIERSVFAQRDVARERNDELPLWARLCTSLSRWPPRDSETAKYTIGPTTGAHRFVRCLAVPLAAPAEVQKCAPLERATSESLEPCAG